MYIEYLKLTWHSVLRTEFNFIKAINRFGKMPHVAEIL